MITYVTYKDYIGIKGAFTEEEIRLKYGRLVIKSEDEYREMKLGDKECKKK